MRKTTGCICAVALLLAAGAWPAEAQRGLAEFGTFGQFSSFDNELGFDNSAGIGGRIGFFLDSRFEVEAEGAYVPLDRTLAGMDLNYTPLYARLNFNPPFGTARTSFIVGGGVVRSSYRHTYNWGPSALVGMRFGLGPRLALRADAVADYLPTPEHFNTSFRVGLSFFRLPPRLTVMEARGIVVDSATWEAQMAERQRLLDIERRYRALLDSVARLRDRPAGVDASVGIRARVNSASVYFDFDRSNIRSDAQATLDQLVPIFQANPSMEILITGHADPRGSDQYNLLLAMRRAESTRSYIVSRGISAGRITVATAGEREPAVQGMTEAAHAQNRRAEFAITAGGDNLVEP